MVTACGSPLPPRARQEIERIKDRLSLVAQQIAEVEAERDEVVRQGAELSLTDVSEGSEAQAAVKIATLHRLKGIGENDATLLTNDIFYRTFRNRRELASWVGITPTSWASGGSVGEAGELLHSVCADLGPPHQHRRLLPQQGRRHPADWCDPRWAKRRRSRPQSAIHDAGIHCVHERQCHCLVARRGSAGTRLHQSVAVQDAGLLHHRRDMIRGKHESWRGSNLVLVLSDSTPVTKDVLDGS